jgi:hypothetical protein
MPDMYVSQQQFELQRVDFVSPEASGRLNGVQAGFPLWSGVWTLARMPVENSDEWRAFFTSTRGQTRRFIGRDIARSYPREYPDGFAGMTRGGGGSFDGTATSWSESVDSDGDSHLTLNGLPASFVLSQGDYIEFRYSATEDSVSGLSWRALVRVVAAATANGSGVATVTVEPPVPAAVPSDAVAHLDEPGCTMAMVIDQSSLGPVDRLYSIQSGQLAGVQDIRS